MKYLIYLLAIVVLAGQAMSFTSQEIIYDGEQVRFTPILDACVNTTSVFRVERLNHTSNSTPLTINYIHAKKTSNHSITKEINKFSTTKTGNFTANETQLTIHISNVTLNWDVSTLCEPHTPEVQLAQACPETFSIVETPAQISQGQTIRFSFLFDTEPEEFRITYTVHDHYGKLLKTTTTENTNTKQYTPKTEKGYILLKARADTSCGIYEDSASIGIQEQEQHETIYLSTEDKGTHVYSELQIENPELKKYTLYYTDESNNKIMEPLNIHFLEEGIRVQVTQQKPRARALHASIQGKYSTQQTVHFFDKEPIQLLESKARQTKYSTVFNWYSKVQGEPPYIVLVRLQNQTQIHVLNTSASQTLKSTFTHPPEQGTIITEIIGLQQQSSQEDAFSLQKEKKEVVPERVAPNISIQSPPSAPKEPATTTILGGGLLTGAAILFAIRVYKGRKSYKAIDVTESEAL